MGWGNITGEQKILPSALGNQNELVLESNKPKKIRLLLQEGEEPYSYLEHALENETIQDGKTVRLFRTIRCPKTSQNPNAPCPLCNGQQAPRRVRNAANVWDYDEGAVKKLNHGDSVWKPIATTRQMGIDVLKADFAIMRTGTNRNDTEYTVTNLGVSEFNLPSGHTLHNIAMDYAPHTELDMKQVVESIGIDWDKITNPPALQFPISIDAAMGHKMPNGKYKDQTMGDIFITNPGMIEYLGIKSDRMSPEKSAAMVILKYKAGKNIDGVPEYDASGMLVGAGTVQATQPVQTPVQTATQPVQATPAPAQPVTNQNATNVSGVSRQEKINTINSLLTGEKFKSGGYTLIVETLKQASNGKSNIQEFSDEELDKMIELCK